ncbi:ricin-type beta-trefoil lectin domain protein [Streptomyces sp. NPDC008001]|uniref:RICIN domain-containing protein n=1 Tax=Streptomyces sp. NPDC008001 TaxID=3364804 RepID=UPI0036E57CD8
MKNVKKTVLAHLAAAIVIAPLAVVGVSGAASAHNGDVETWRNVATKRCLTHDGKHKVYTAAQRSCTQGWTERAIREYSGGQGIYQLAWHVAGKDLLCLDSSDAGRVYMNPCNKGRYQMWEQIKSSRGWELTNVATGRVLDSTDSGTVYTNPQNFGPYQHWT